MAQAILSLGTNQGNRDENLAKAINLIHTEVGTVIAVSSIYETEPWGFEAEQWFLNMALMVETDMHPFDLLYKTQAIERSLGRDKKTNSTQGYHSRTIDIDIIFFDQRVIKTPELSIPHPLMQKRNFVLKPVAEIAPYFYHPLLELPVIKLLQECEDSTRIRFYASIKEFTDRVLQG